MLIPRISRGQPERVYITVRNMHSTTLADGDVVSWMLSTDTWPTNFTNDKKNGVDVKQSAATANLVNVAGVMSITNVSVAGATATLAQGEYGLCQIYGLHKSVKSTTGTAGTAVGTVATAGSLGDASGAGTGAEVPAAYIGLCIITRDGTSGRSGILIQKM